MCHLNQHKAELSTPSHRLTEVAQSCPTLCDCMDCSPPGSSVHGIFQAWILEWVAVSFSRGSSWPRDRTRVSRIVGRCLTIWATREAHQKHRRVVVSFKRMSVEIFYRWNLLPRSQLANYMHSWRQEAAKKGPTGKYLGNPIRSSYSASVDLKWSSSTVDVWLFATPWPVAHQAPLSMGFFSEHMFISFFRHSTCQSDRAHITLLFSLSPLRILISHPQNSSGKKI